MHIDLVLNLYILCCLHLFQGITFHNLDSEKPFRETVEYIWSDNDWPNDGWAGSESTPVPNFVSQGIGLGNKKAAHIGLSGTKTLARPGRDMTGGGAFGISGYAGIGASGLGWGEPEDFEIIDPPATTENISTRSLCSHPSRPLFLAGSLNTHIYLWEVKNHTFLIFLKFIRAYHSLLSKNLMLNDI